MDGVSGEIWNSGLSTYFTKEKLKKKKENCIAGVTECPIQPGVSFLYSFTIQEQFGTFCKLNEHFLATVKSTSSETTKIDKLNNCWIKGIT
jgi:hypothetical protein